MENRGGVRVTLERLAGDFILRTMRSYGDTLRRRKCGNMLDFFFFFKFTLKAL